MAEHGCGHEPYFKDNADRWKEITIGNDSVRFPVSGLKWRDIKRNDGEGEGGLELLTSPIIRKNPFVSSILISLLMPRGISL